MKTRIHYNKINIKPAPHKNGRIYCLLKRPLNEYSKPICYCDMNIGQRSYPLPCARKNIVGLYINIKMNLTKMVLHSTD